MSASEPQWFQEWSRTRIEDAERLDRLESATDRMADGAAELSSALSTYATKDEVKKVESNAVSQDEVQVVARTAAAEGLVKQGRRALALAITLFVISLVFAGAGVAYVYSANHHQCQVRVDSSRKSLAAYNNLLTSPTIRHDPNLHGFILAAKAAAERGAKVHC